LLLIVESVHRSPQKRWSKVLEMVQCEVNETFEMNFASRLIVCLMLYSGIAGCIKCWQECAGTELNSSEPIWLQPKYVIRKLGETVNLTCLMSGHDPIVFDWRRNNRQVTTTSDPSITSGRIWIYSQSSQWPLFSVLVVRRLTLDTLGRYTCRVMSLRPNRVEWSANACIATLNAADQSTNRKRQERDSIYLLIALIAVLIGSFALLILFRPSVNGSFVA
jgi:hypothetical protein